MVLNDSIALTNGIWCFQNMGCLDGNCPGSTCKPDLISPHIPPAKVGWRLVGWPDFVPDSLRSSYGANPTWEGNTHQQVIDAIRNVLKTNRVKIDSGALCRWANDQWCAADPVRCQKVRGKVESIEVQRSRGLFGSQMLWATSFWQLWNVAVSDANRPEHEVSGTMERFVEIARSLLSGDSGCTKCAEHFEELQAAYPIEKVTTWRQARVWLWHVHNSSRDSGKIVPYGDIARIYQWETLTEPQVAEIVASLAG